MLFVIRIYGYSVYFSCNRGSYFLWSFKLRNYTERVRIDRFCNLSLWMTIRGLFGDDFLSFLFYINTYQSRNTVNTIEIVAIFSFRCRWHASLLDPCFGITTKLICVWLLSQMCIFRWIPILLNLLSLLHLIPAPFINLLFTKPKFSGKVHLIIFSPITSCFLKSNVKGFYLISIFSNSLHAQTIWVLISIRIIFAGK